MPILKITAGDRLTSSLTISLEAVAKCDICDPNENFWEVRQMALADLQKIRTDAAAHGCVFEELYADAISHEEALADFHSASAME